MKSAAQEQYHFAAREIVLELSADNTRSHRASFAIQDILGGLALWRLAMTLGWLDIRLRYRGSVLGPFWLTLSTAVMVTTLGTVWGALFNMNLHDFLPYLTLSQVLWTFINTITAESTTCFTMSEGVIRSVRMPLFVHSLRVAVRNLLVLAHNLVVIVGVFLIFSVWPGWRIVMSLPALPLWVIDSLAIGLLLGAIGARFRDIPPIIGSIMQIAFFITPIIYRPEQLGRHAWLLIFNPLSVLLDIVRAPLLGQLPSMASWIAALVYSAVLLCVTWCLFVRARGRVAFWL